MAQQKSRPLWSRRTCSLAAAAAVLTLLKSSLGLLIAASKRGARGYGYNFTAVVFLSEVAKLLCSAVLLFTDSSSSSSSAGPPRPKHPHHRRRSSITSSANGSNSSIGSTGSSSDLVEQAVGSLWFLIPSVIYLLLNHCQFALLLWLDPTTVQVLGNQKIIATGLLFRILLGRQLSPIRWLSLLLLAVGTTTTQVSSACGASASSLQSGIAGVPWQGYAFGLASALLSALGAVSTEWLLKYRTPGASLYRCNLQLYGYGALVNAVYYVALGGGGGSGGGGLTRGFTPATWAVVANLAFSGLLVSWIMKHADSILKVYSASLAVVLTMAASVAWFDLRVTIELLLGIATVCVSLALYYLPPRYLLPPENEAGAEPPPSPSLSSSAASALAAKPSIVAVGKMSPVKDAAAMPRRSSYTGLANGLHHTAAAAAHGEQQRPLLLQQQQQQGAGDPSFYRLESGDSFNGHLHHR